jgi:hypothetical protein
VRLGSVEDLKKGIASAERAEESEEQQIKRARIENRDSASIYVIGE